MQVSSGVRGLASPDLWVVNGLIGVVFGAAVSGVRRLHALHQESLTDPLTGVANRRAFFRALASACQDAGAKGQRFSLLLLDLDRFKSVNDTLGHDAGDRLLQGFARTAAHMLRPYGTLYRYGGDEFVAILPGLTLNEAAALAERLRQELAALPARLPGNGGITVSVGVAAYPDHGSTPEELMRSADTALLYGAKMGGRNRVATRALASPPGTADLLWEDVPEEAVALLKVLGAVTGETADHGLRVASLACQLGQRLGLTEEELRVLRLGAIFHDIGKLVIPRALLDKAGPLAESEGEQVSRHAELGAVLVANLGLDPRLADVVRHHHERWDGTGYPDGLRGENIPFLARILAVADAYDAMTAPRPYHAPCSPSEALEELQRGAGHQFDPLVVSAMAQLAARLTARRQAAIPTSSPEPLAAKG